jgi:folate-binding protein YgfZ
MTPGYRGLREGAAWFSISDRTRIRLTGEDRVRLLHALATNVVDAEDTETFLLNPQGRILAHCRVYIATDSVLLESEASSRQAILDYLDQYIIMDDVVVIDETDSTQAIAIEGPESPSIVADGLPPLGIVHPSSLTSSTGIWVELNTEANEQLQQLLANASIPEASPADQLAARVAHGIPVHGLDYTNSNIPHETQLLDMLSFDKGCYVGQEIVERVKSQGQVNRLLSLIELESAEIPADLAVQLGDRTIGTITSPMLSVETGKIRGFSVLRREGHAPESSLTVGGQSAHILPWP